VEVEPVDTDVVETEMVENAIVEQQVITDVVDGEFSTPRSKRRPLRRLPRTRRCPTTPRRRRTNGQKVTPTVSARHHDGLEVALVQGARLQGPRHRGLEDPRLPHQAARERCGEPHRDRAQLGSHPRRHPHRPSGHRDRPPRRRGRAPEEGLEKITGQKNKISLNIQEIKQPELDAALIAQGICDQLLRRVAFRAP